MPKWDRQGVRTPADVERKYNLGADYTEIMQVARDAQNTANAAIRTVASFVAGVTADIADIIARLEALEGVSVIVNVTDTMSAVESLLTTYGTLFVAGQPITENNAEITITGGEAVVTYTVKQAIGTVRTVTVNDIELGTVSAVGDTVTATVAVRKDSELLIAFAS